MFGEIGGAMELIMTVATVFVGLALMVALGKFWES
jgi:hypothetical protein